jgi:hypothetical protein
MIFEREFLFQTAQKPEISYQEVIKYLVERAHRKFTILKLDFMKP